MTSTGPLQISNGALRLRSLFAALAVLLFALVWQRPGAPDLFPGRGDDRVLVYVIDNGLHSDLVLPAEALRARGGPAARALAGLPTTDWVSVGWGDRRFYRESGLGPDRWLDALRALFMPGNRSVVRLHALPRPPEAYYAVRPIALPLSREGFERLAGRLDASFAGADGAPLTASGPQPGPGRFYEGAETFSIVRLCNHWTSDLLHEAGVPTRPVLATVGAGLAFDLRHRVSRLDSAGPAA